jgi:hypothetical protein
LSAESGRLGVRQLTEFNTALLGKWCWRMLVDKRGLSYRVLAGRYGEVAGRVAAGGRRDSPWWREIARIRDGVGEATKRGWFGEGVVRRVGSGTETLFWSDLWLVGVSWASDFSDCLPFPSTRCARLWRSGTYGGEIGVGRGCGVVH